MTPRKLNEKGILAIFYPVMDRSTVATNDLLQ